MKVQEDGAEMQVGPAVEDSKGDMEDIFRVIKQDGFCQPKYRARTSVVRWIASGKDVAAVYGWAMVPFFYIWGILCLVLKLVLLNPPILTQLFQSNLRAEIFLYGQKPKNLPQDNGPFLEIWYDPNRKVQPWQSRFNTLQDTMFLESFAFAPWLITPPMATKMTRYASNENDNFRELSISSSHGDMHFLHGDVFITQRNGRVVLETNLKAWFFLIPLYKLLFSSCFSLMRSQYGKELARLQLDP